MVPFQDSKPLFVRRQEGIIFRGIKYGCDKPFPWKELNVDYKDVAIMYSMQQLYHNDDLETTHKVGDRFIELTAKNLQSLVTLTNKEIKDKSLSKTEFNKNKIKVSRIFDKQIGLLRSWVSRNEQWEEIMDFINKTKVSFLESQGSN